MKETELWELLVSLSANETSLEETHARILHLFDFMQSESPKCLKCGAGENKQSCIGKWEDGEEYRCDECGNEWDFHHFA